MKTLPSFLVCLMLSLWIDSRFNLSRRPLLTSQKSFSSQDAALLPLQLQQSSNQGHHTHNNEVNLDTHVTVDSLIDLWALVEE